MASTLLLPLPDADVPSAVVINFPHNSRRPRRVGAPEELAAQQAIDAVQQELSFEAWIIAQLKEIGERHGAREDENVGEVLERAALCGDSQAAKLIEMGCATTVGGFGPFSARR